MNHEAKNRLSSTLRLISAACALAIGIHLCEFGEAQAQWTECPTSSGNQCLPNSKKLGISYASTPGAPTAPLEFVLPSGTQFIDPVIKVSGLVAATNTLLQPLLANGSRGWKLLVGGGFGEYFHIAGDDGVPRFMINVSSGNVRIGNGFTEPTAKLDVDGNLNVSGNIAAKYQDVAEWVPSPQALEPGTVVVLDETEFNQVGPSFRPYDTKVAGVVSARPGLLLGEQGEGKVKVATTGRVKVKADARTRPIRSGDLLVTGTQPGTAMASEPIEVSGRQFHQPGTILGKALEALPNGEAEILVLLTLQ